MCDIRHPTVTHSPFGLRNSEYGKSTTGNLIRANVRNDDFRGFLRLIYSSDLRFLNPKS